MISWAGHGEDQILRRILINRDPGTFIDIGAAHPKFGSVTYAFYKLGWRGISIEPRNELAKAWKKTRPEDLLIVAALTLTGRNGYILNRGFRSKFIDENELKSADQYSRSKAVSTSELAEIINEHLNVAPTFIKIDIEGKECEVVESLISNRIMPELWLIEVVDQYQSEHIRRESSARLKSFLEVHGYQLALFDGVNEWYVLESSETLNRNIWAPAYPGVEDFIPFHLTTNYRIRNYINLKRRIVLKSLNVFIKTAMRGT